MGDAIGILLVIVLAIFFVDSMYPDMPWFPDKQTSKNDPIIPKWR